MDKSLIGFCGYPDPYVINKLKVQYPNATWLDLDVELSFVTDYKILPQVYCKIIKNIVNNAIYYKDKLITIVMATGREKCDSAAFASMILKDFGFNVVETKYENIDVEKRKPIISTSNLPLVEKIQLITKEIVEPIDKTKLKFVKPRFGFWGVPPNDLSILKLFPDDTHVYGWTRCVEMGVPACYETEIMVDKNVPTVFYAQAFCAKASLAKYLSFKYNGLYVDIDDVATNSIVAKIEAFINLR
ncbi:MAG: hypothetical protein MRZ90_05265 [Candidatus Gastranaerophilales bacterium]|nr:hypothetical protein [Candidatus Gastranaerophilales bacterium]